jgi:hypothetical protein
MATPTDAATLGSFARFQLPSCRGFQAGSPTVLWLTSDNRLAQSVDDLGAKVKRQNRSQVHLRLRFAQTLASFRKNVLITLRCVQKSIRNACCFLDSDRWSWVRSAKFEHLSEDWVRSAEIRRASHNWVRSADFYRPFRKWRSADSRS